MPIKFGTDGWRAVIAEDYTFENVRFCAQGTAAFLKAHQLDSRGIYIGYDTRFGSEDFAAAVAEVTAANGIPTYLCDRAAPTPVAAYNLVAGDGGGGVVITASHNPAQWNGFKYKPDYGGSASPEIVTLLEEYIEDAEKSGDVKRMTLTEAVSQGLLEYIDPEPTYLSHMATLVNLEAIRNAGLDVVVDVMHGAGAGYFPKLLEGGSTRVFEMRSERNPSFPGMAQPEPLAHNLQSLMEDVQDRTADVGLATDGDADRLGVVDDSGRFITTLETFALLCYHQLEVLKNSGPLVRSITMTSMIDKLGELYDVPVFDTPVGFKYLGPVMMREDALIAGEESGGYAFRGNIPERDGILSGLMLLDLMVKTEKGVSDLLEELTAKVGPHFYDRLDLKFEESQRQTILGRIQKAAPASFAGRKVQSIDTRDGYRFVLDGGYWALIRFSGTEPLLRVYAEAESPADVQAILDEARNMAGV
ncbi:MAG: phosphoglucomutase/phosphomannomutase family protein [Chloroflexi bacterium]|nr:phosphoglucomutase/phosphomannomutase family protein [Chloroflexota bacterium]MDA1227445.1 phosphoglucomutase/phosphomannomutase family protein [Chloroflexota bacterium]